MPRAVRLGLPCVPGSWVSLWPCPGPAALRVAKLDVGDTSFMFIDPHRLLKHDFFKTDETWFYNWSSLVCNVLSWQTTKVNNRNGRADNASLIVGPDTRLLFFLAAASHSSLTNKNTGGLVPPVYNTAHTHTPLTHAPTHA